MAANAMARGQQIAGAASGSERGCCTAGGTYTTRSTSVRSPTTAAMPNGDLKTAMVVCAAETWLSSCARRLAQSAIPLCLAPCASGDVGAGEARAEVRLACLRGECLPAQAAAHARPREDWRPTEARPCHARGARTLVGRRGARRSGGGKRPVLFLQVFEVRGHHGVRLRWRKVIAIGAVHHNEQMSQREWTFRKYRLLRSYVRIVADANVVERIVTMPGATAHSYFPHIGISGGEFAISVLATTAPPPPRHPHQEQENKEG